MKTEHHDNGIKKEDEVVTALKKKNLYSSEKLRTLRELFGDDLGSPINFDKIKKIARSKFIGRVELEKGNSFGQMDVVEKVVKNLEPIVNKENNVRAELDRGRAILVTEDQLDQYWKSHGPVVKSQWDNVFNVCKNINIDFFDSDFEIIDYGCGQGMASILFLDNYWDFEKNIYKIKLIDPSTVALQRARGIIEIYQFFSSKIQIVGINKKLDDIEKKDLETSHNLNTIHFFSNILDMDVFELDTLLKKILENKGRHLFLAVSHDRYHDGGSSRLKYFYNKLIKYKHIKINRKEELKKFEWDVGKRKYAIRFIIDLEVLG
jgi:SAM-dependent methyltransferase